MPRNCASSSFLFLTCSLLPFFLFLSFFRIVSYPFFPVLLLCSLFLGQEPCRSAVNALAPVLLGARAKLSGQRSGYSLVSCLAY